jgi:type VI secretion system ImpH/TssG family protein
VSFFQMVRQLEARSGQRVGTDTKPAQEPVSFKVDVDANFPAAELAKMTDDTVPPTLAVSFFGLFGASGALPYHYSQLIADRARTKDYALRDFLDMFNHRLLAFFYRCWKKHQFPIAFETAHAADQEDALTLGLWALIGNRTQGLAGRLAIPDETFLYLPDITRTFGLRPMPCGRS